jgi:hypothetical protein
MDHDAMKIAIHRARIHELEEIIAEVTYFGDALANLAERIAGLEPSIAEAVSAYRLARGVIENGFTPTDTDFFGVHRGEHAPARWL